jgi:type I restriction enzyme S subunit
MSALSYVPAKFLYHVIDNRAGGLAETLPLLSVSVSRGVIRRDEITEKEARADDLLNYKVCAQRDIVINRMSAYQGALGISPVDGLVSPDYLVLRANSKAEPRFLTYLFRSTRFVGGMTARLRGIGSTDQGNVRTPRINEDELGRITVAIPTPIAQRAIADYLDRETVRIDALISAKRRMVELLDERLQGSISASTQARSAVDSSHPLPNGWTLMPLKRCLSSTAYGIGESTRAEGEYAVLGMTNISSGEVVGAPGGFVSAVDTSLLLAPGDLLFNRTNSRELVGKVGLVRSLERPTTFASYLVRLRANRLANAQYLNYLLNAAEVLGLARSMALPSIGQANLNPNRYSTMMLPIPPVHEQRSLVAHLDALASRTIGIRRTLERQVALLRERRQALVTAAVTGQLDIPEAA